MTSYPQTFDAEHTALHVRKSNHAAFHLYSQTLKYDINDIEKGYYADGEDAYDMRKYFKNRPGDKATADAEEADEEMPALAPVDGSEDDGAAGVAGGDAGGDVADGATGADDPPPVPNERP